MLEREILESVKTGLKSWREELKMSSMRYTRIDLSASQALSKILEVFESSKVGDNDGSENTFLEAVYSNGRLKGILDTKNVHGIPVNLPFSDMRTVLEEVKATGVYFSNDSQARFAVAARVFPLPCNVYSVWVYILRMAAR